MSRKYIYVLIFYCPFLEAVEKCFGSNKPEQKSRIKLGKNEIPEKIYIQEFETNML